MSDLDEGRDVRAAFGTLLADEPTSPWSASDDVTRGRALQRRRRTRAGAGVGLAAAVVMVFGVFGPWRPEPVVVVPPAYQPPVRPGRRPGLARCAGSRSFTAVNGRGRGLVALDGHLDVRRRIRARPQPGRRHRDDGWRGLHGRVRRARRGRPSAARLRHLEAAWAAPAPCSHRARCRRARAPSPACRPASPRRAVAGTPTARRSPARSSSTRPTRPAAMLEIAYALRVVMDGVVGGRDCALNYGGITYVLDRVGRPPAVGAPSRRPVRCHRAARRPRLDRRRRHRPACAAGPAHRDRWVSAPRAGTERTPLTQPLTVRTWDERSWKPGEGRHQPRERHRAAAPRRRAARRRRRSPTASGRRLLVDVVGYHRDERTSPPAGSYILYAYDEGAQHAVEVGRRSRASIVACPVAGDCRPAAFLNEQETAQVVARRAEAARATASTPPPVTPPTPAGSDDRRDARA